MNIHFQMSKLSVITMLVIIEKVGTFFPAKINSLFLLFKQKYSNCTMTADTQFMINAF